MHAYTYQIQYGGVEAKYDIPTINKHQKWILHTKIINIRGITRENSAGNKEEDFSNMADQKWKLTNRKVCAILP